MEHDFKCKQCGKDFKNPRLVATFCSKKCANEYNGKLVSEKQKEEGKYIECDVCKKLKPPNDFSYLIKDDISSGKKNHCKQCGRNNRERLRRERTWKNEAEKVLLSNSRQRALANNLENTLTIDDIVIPDICPVLGIPIMREFKDTWYNAPSIDRIDNTKGYTKDNIVVVSRRANIIKKNATIEELVKLADFYKPFLDPNNKEQPVNIFVVDLDPVKAAIHLHDKHVNKLLLESAQLLCTTRRLLGDTNPNLYKIAFQNHPCTVWTRQSKENYLWLLDHFNALCSEYTYRYFRQHKCANLLVHLAQEIDGFPLQGLTPFALAMPDEFKQEDPVASYRAYYLGKKIQGQFWTHRAQHELEPWLASQLHPSQFKELDYT